MLEYKNMRESDQVVLLTTGDERVFEFIYHQHVRELYRFAQSRLRSDEDSKEMVQSIFVDLWEKRESLSHVTALTPYLYRMLKNRLVEHYRHKLVRNKYAEDFAFFESTARNTTEDVQNLQDTKTLIEESVAAMPPRMRMAFRLSREENLSISNIAVRMNISPRTAETLITKALKRLRTSLGSSLTLFYWVDCL